MEKYSSPCLSRIKLKRELKRFKDKYVLIVLKPGSIKISNCIFRPIINGKIEDVTDEYLEIHNITLRIPNRISYIFPNPLIIPLNNIIMFSPVYKR